MKNNYSSGLSLKLYALCQRYPWIRKVKVILYFFDSFFLLFIRKPKKKSQTKKQIFIMFNYAFGDGIIWLTAISDLRKIYPQNEYEITLMCQRGLGQIYENSNLFDKVIPYNLTESTFNIKERFKLYKQLRQKHYDIVIDPIGVSECTTNIFMSRVLCSNKKITILDVTIDNQMCPAWLYKKIYTKVFKINEPKISLLDYYAEILRQLGLNNYEVKLNRFNPISLRFKIPKEYYIVFPSASTELKRWPIDRYAEIVKRIYNKTKLPILLCGTEMDRKYYNDLLSLIPNVPYIDIISKTSLVEFIEVIKRAKFVVTNDTSTYHIAVVNEIPVAIITGGYTYDKYVLYNFKGNENYIKPYVIVKENECFNCDNICCRLKSNDKIWPCLNDITVDYAWKIIDQMITKEYKKMR